jgi:polyhydroxybutyrate depolymerase
MGRHVIVRRHFCANV